ncbi:hypothetical protein [Aeromonas salmonicida]|nr:hypothetical protein [Aeromonas salmonicida]
MTMIKPEMKEKIVRAAESLRSEGVVKPTNEQVRERMGGRLPVSYLAGYA